MINDNMIIGFAYHCNGTAYNHKERMTVIGEIIMAKGLLKHQERKSALSLLGKDLARRARSKCELCEASGVPLTLSLIHI